MFIYCARRECNVQFTILPSLSVCDLFAVEMLHADEFKTEDNLDLSLP